MVPVEVAQQDRAVESGAGGHGPYHEAALALADGVDILLHDAQHTATEYEAFAERYAGTGAGGTGEPGEPWCGKPPTARPDATNCPAGRWPSRARR